MVGLTSPFVPLQITAWLQQGIAVDPRHGVALDGVLASQVRDAQAYALAPGTPGSVLDGGLAEEVPVEITLPLARCESGTGEWHWLATTGQPVNHLGEPVSLTPDPHRLLGSLDERRAEQVAIALPKHVGGPRGRYRNRLTPVLVVPAAGFVWRAVGDIEALRGLLEPLTTVGARRGSGEGTVTRWEFQITSPENPDFFAHTHPDGALGRPVPQSCASRLGIQNTVTVIAGIRPPMFHSSRQRSLVLSGPPNQ